MYAWEKKIFIIGKHRGLSHEVTARRTAMFKTLNIIVETTVVYTQEYLIKLSLIGRIS